MAYEFTIQRRVEFSETDMAGIMHFSNFFKFMETAEHAFYRSLGFSVVGDAYDPPIGFPRVHCDCTFKRPIRFEDLIDVRLLVKEKKRKAIAYQFHFHPAEDRETMLAIGHLTIVCVRHQADGSMAATAIPDEIAAAIDPAPPELLGLPPQR